MAKPSELHSFIQGAVRSGKSLAEARKVLEDAGWGKDALDPAFERYHPADFPVAVPRPGTFASPRLFFLNAFYFLALYTVIYTLVACLFTFLDHYLPDGHGVLNSSPLGNDLLNKIATLIVFAPMVWLADRLIRSAAQKLGQTAPKIRLILVYFTMFIGAMVTLTTLCLFVYYLLSGEMSLRFMIKMGILGAMAGLIWLYFKDELKRDERAA